MKPAPAVFGHAGLGLGYPFPPNSAASVQGALLIGAQGSEVDLQLSSDGIGVVYHDADLSSATNGDGSIRSHTWDALRPIRYASVHGVHPLLRADSVLAMHIAHGRTVTFDCKLHPAPGEDAAEYVTRFADALAQLLGDSLQEAHAMVESSDIRLLRLLKESRPSLRLFIYPPDFDEGLRIADALDLYGITIDIGKVSGPQIAEAHRHHRRVTVFGLHTKKENRKAFSMLPDFLQSDKLRYALRVVGRYDRQQYRALGTGR